MKDLGFDVDVRSPSVPMFQPFRLREMMVPNRVVVSPMDMYSARDGVPGDWHLVHYGSRATGGAGLVFTEMTCVSPQARITLGWGLWNDEQEAAWRRVVDFVHAHSAAKFCLQLGHSGRREPRSSCGRDGPSPGAGRLGDLICFAPPYFPDSQVPREIARPRWTA